MYFDNSGHLWCGTVNGLLKFSPEKERINNLEPLTRDFKGDLTVAIGLEVADDELLNRLNKGFGLKDVERAYSVLDALGISSRVYILVGPPFVGDPKTSALDSVRYAKRIGFTEISLLGAYPMENTLGYELWNKRTLRTHKFTISSQLLYSNHTK